jgi:hypothetical protein
VTTRTLPDALALADAIVATNKARTDAIARLVHLQLLAIAADAVRENPAARYLTVWESEETLCVFPSAVYDAVGHYLPDVDVDVDNHDFAEAGQEWAWVGFVTEDYPIEDLEGDSDVLDLHAVLDPDVVPWPT